MTILFIIAAILGIVGFFTLMASITEADFGIFVVAVVIAALTFGATHDAFKRLNHERNSRHELVYNQLQRQGINVPYSRLQLVSPDYYSSQIQINEGGCLFNIDVSKYGNTWHADVPLANSPNGHFGYKTLSARALSKLAAVCKAR